MSGNVVSLQFHIFTSRGRKKSKWNTDWMAVYSDKVFISFLLIKRSRPEKTLLIFHSLAWLRYNKNIPWLVISKAMLFSHQTSAQIENEQSYGRKSMCFQLQFVQTDHSMVSRDLELNPVIFPRGHTLIKTFDLQVQWSLCISINKLLLLSSFLLHQMQLTVKLPMGTVT